MGFYFAFLHHYTRWLSFIALPSLLSLVIQLMPPSVVCGNDGPEAEAGSGDGVGSGGIGGGIGGGMSVGMGGGMGVGMGVGMGGADAGSHLTTGTNRSDGDGSGDARRLCEMWSGLDNVFVPGFAIAISVWAALFLEYWKRYQSVRLLPPHY